MKCDYEVDAYGRPIVKDASIGTKLFAYTLFFLFIGIIASAFFITLKYIVHNT
ncbi:MAG: hypothetical protein ACE5K4_02325 [Candidatus Hydrothermarchaeota archaeon]